MSEIMVQVALPTVAIRDFCVKWGVRELALFGPVLRPDFTPTSDVDVLVDFLPGTRRSLLDLAQMEQELAALWGREVDILKRRGVESAAPMPFAAPRSWRRPT